LRKLIARAFLWLTGWRPEGARPVAPRYVLIAAPHTSNWDLAYLLALAEVFDVRVSWMGKHSLFRPPLGFVMRRVGGIPVVRHKRGNLVAAVAKLFTEHAELALVVPAEGTRAYVPHWKSGFYHIARSAQVPIVLGYLDYARKRGGFGPALLPTGDLRKDMDEIRDFYADKTGKYPDQFGAIRLKEED
jgi:1-acyl-sn-glycerol-3-phosphate acyltransferase